jgi:phosphoglycolate phosphatase
VLASAPRVVLFDLDGTVLTYDGESPGPGRTALEAAMRQLHAVEHATEGFRMAGGTDRALARRMLARAGLGEDDDAIAAVLACYVGHLEALLRIRSYKAIGDVAGAVGALRARGAIVGVATGNVREGAALKLASAGLEGTFDLALGGFGGDAELRADIVRIAAERCSMAAAGGAIVVVGDTELDVRAGRAIGARVVGVAHDGKTHDELVEAGADAIVTACGEALVAAVFA